MQLIKHTNDDPVEFLLSLLNSQDRGRNYDEISRLEHALQCATHAKKTEPRRP
jgi:predicted HD phosphohydrolase